MCLFICDANLRDYGGHYYEYAVSVAEAAQKTGIETIILGNRHFLPDPHDPQCRHIRPCLENVNIDWMRDFFPLIEKGHIKGDDDVFFPSLWPEDFISFIQAFALKEPPGCPRFHFVLRRDLADFASDLLVKLSYVLKNLPHNNSLAHRIRLYSDTDALCRQYAYLAFPAPVTIHLLPIPFRHQLLGEPCKNTKVTICYLGDARPEKGFQLLPEAVTYLVDRLKEGIRYLRFDIQSNFNVPGGEAGMADALRELTRQSSCEINLIEGPLSPETYYRMLTRADIVLLPYNRERYRHRSSGILVESLCAGKVVIVPQNTWMASQVDSQCAVLLEEDSQLGPAIYHGLINLKTLSLKAREQAQTFRNRHSTERLCAVLRQRMPSAGCQKEEGASKQAILIADEWSIFYPNGAHTVILAQIQSLQRLGFRIHLLVCLDWWTDLGNHKDIVMQLSAWAHDQGIHHIGFAWLPERLTFNHTKEALALEACLEKLGDKQDGIDLMLKLKSFYQIDPGFLDRIEQCDIDIALINYVHNIPVCDKLPAKGYPTICETHDIQSKKALFGEHFSDYDTQLKEEIGALKRCSGVIFINHEELDEIKNRVKPAKAIYLLPALNGRKDLHPQICQTQDLKSTLELSSPMMPMAAWPQMKRDNILGQKGIDLFYVSSSNPCNIHSLKWFYDQVYMPYLKDHQVNVFIAGCIDADQFTHPQDKLFSIGPVLDLKPLYRQARVVILPVTRGTGTAIKTLEAIHFGKAVVGTRPAFRGLGDLDCSDLIAADAFSFAEKAKTLLFDQVHRKKTEETILAMQRKLCNSERYDQALGSLINTLE